MSNLDQTSLSVEAEPPEEPAETGRRGITWILRDLIAGWWRDVSDADGDGRLADRASLAAMRRLGRVAGAFPPMLDEASAAAIPAYRSLRERLGRLDGKYPGWLPADWPQRSVLIAAVLAHVRKDVGRRETGDDRVTFARLLGPPTGDPEAAPCMNEQRFRRLVRIEHFADLLEPVRQGVALLDREAPVGQLGAGLMFWCAAERRDWAVDYWHLPSGRPSASREETTSSDSVNPLD